MRGIYTSIMIGFLIMFLQACGETPPTVGGTNSAVQVAEHAIAEGRYRTAHDALLHAMISNPSESSLFEHVLALVGVLLDTGHGEALDFAEDLLGRLDQMVPYQSLDRHVMFREQLEQAWRRLENSAADPQMALNQGAEPSQVTAGHFATLDGHLRLLERDDLPPAVQLAALDDAVAERDRSVLWAIQAGALDAADVEDVWRRYAQRLEAAENRVLKKLFDERVMEFDAILHEHRTLTKELVQPLDLNELGQLRERNVRVREAGWRLGQWEREFHGHLENGVADAAAQIQLATNTRTHLAWNYSQMVLGWTKSIDVMKMTDKGWFSTTAREQEFEATLSGLPRSSTEAAIDYANEHRNSDPAKAEAMVKILLLTLVDADLTVPYVRERYEDVWRKNTENLDEAGRVEAAKIRILRGLP